MVYSVRYFYKREKEMKENKIKGKKICFSKFVIPKLTFFKIIIVKRTNIARIHTFGVEHGLYLRWLFISHAEEVQTRNGGGGAHIVCLLFRLSGPMGANS